MKFQTFESFTRDAVKLVFVGDIMQHQNQIDDESLRGYSYRDTFTEASPILDAADYSIGNLETLFAGLDVVRHRDNGNPVFSAPDSLARSLRLAGFDALSVINNHMHDHGQGGLQRTVSIIEREGMLPLEGSHIVQINGLDIAFHPDTSYINDHDAGNRKMIKHSDLRISPFSDCFNIALVHWGGQFEGITSRQRKMCDSLISKGFDMIIGSGPHIEQPVEMIGDTLVAWSLGNFLSSHEGYNADKPNEGIMLEVEIGDKLKWNKINTQNNKIVLQ